MIVQIVLLGIAAFIIQSEYALGTSLPSRPIVTGLFTGIVLGNAKTGIITGAILELAFIGSFSVGASILPDVMTGGVLGTVFAVTAGASAETALLLSLPIAMLTLILKNIYLGLLISTMNHKADSCAEEGNYGGVEHIYLLTGLNFSSMLGIIVMASYMVGNNTIGNLLNKVPDLIQDGLPIAIGLIPALGFAMSARLLVNEQIAPYFFLGFTTASYLKIPVTGVAIFDTISTTVVVDIMSIRQLPLQITVGEVEEDEEF